MILSFFQPNILLFRFLSLHFLPFFFTFISSPSCSRLSHYEKGWFTFAEDDGKRSLVSGRCNQQTLHLRVALNRWLEFGRDEPCLYSRKRNMHRYVRVIRPYRGPSLFSHLLLASFLSFSGFVQSLLFILFIRRSEFLKIPTYLSSHLIWHLYCYWISNDVNETPSQTSRVSPDGKSFWGIGTNRQVDLVGFIPLHFSFLSELILLLLLLLGWNSGESPFRISAICWLESQHYLVNKYDETHGSRVNPNRYLYWRDDGVDGSAQSRE